MRCILLLCLGGAAGSFCRYFLSGLTHRVMGVGFPWGTLVVNMTGCFSAGMVWALAAGHWAVGEETHIFLMAGFLGGFTTFSTYMLETGELLRTAQYAMAAANLFLQNTLGLLALVAGFLIGQPA